MTVFKWLNYVNSLIETKVIMKLKLALVWGVTAILKYYGKLLIYQWITEAISVYFGCVFKSKGFLQKVLFFTFINLTYLLTIILFS